MERNNRCSKGVSSMSRVSILEVEDERRNDAMHFGWLSSQNSAKGRRVLTGLEATQSPASQQTRELSEAQRNDRIRRTLKKEKDRDDFKRAQDPAWFLKPILSELTTLREVKATPEPHRVVVVVERVIHTPLDGSRDIWLKISKRNDSRLCQRVPNLSDRRVLTSKYSHFFSIWLNEPPFVDCLAEWTNDEWCLLEIFDPYS